MLKIARNAALLLMAIFLSACAAHAADPSSIRLRQSDAVQYSYRGGDGRIITIGKSGNSYSIDLDGSDVTYGAYRCNIEEKEGRCLYFLSFEFSVLGNLRGDSKWVARGKEYRVVSVVNDVKGAFSIYTIEIFNPVTSEIEMIYKYKPGVGLLSFSFLSAYGPPGWRLSSPYLLTSDIGLFP